jgi:hypothetical protein
MKAALRVLLVAVLAMLLGPFSGTVQADTSVKQIKLTERQVLGFIAAQKDISPLLEKIQGDTADPLPPKIQAELEAVAKKHGFKDFNEYDDVVANITIVMAGIDPATKTYTEPTVAIKKEIAAVTADTSIPANEKKLMLEELEEALKSAQPLEFPGNIELVKKYYDKIDASLS